MITRHFILIILFFTTNALFCQTDSLTPAIPDEIKLSAEDLVLFKQQALQKVKELEGYVIIISDKTQPSSKRNIAEQEALKLFYEGAKMEISSVGTDGKIITTSRPMKEYLYRLKILPFTKVEIKFYDIIYASDFKRDAITGKYAATATIFQEFKGYTGDNMVYATTTKQEISIIIDIINDEFYNEKHWKLFLGDIKAEETKTN
jgi:hypothetical protein